MAVVINFVIDKFVWFMCGAIIIILAIIGSYADKTNFGEGKKIVKVKKKKKDIIDSLEVEEKKDSSDSFNSNSDEPVESENIFDNTNNEIKVESNKVDAAEKVETNQDIPTIEINDKEKKDDEAKNDESEENSSVIDKIIEENKEAKEELDELLPKKDILDDDIFQDLGDLDDIKFDSKITKAKDVPDLDDVMLPDITKQKKNSKQIWKK